MSSSMLPVTAIATTATRTNAKVPADSIVSIRFVTVLLLSLSVADRFLAMRPCVPCHHGHLTDDLAAAHLQLRFDHNPAPVRVLAHFPEPHPAFLTDHLFPLDAVGRLRKESRSQVLGDLRLPAQLEGGGLRG